MRYGPDHPKEKIVSFDMTLLLELMNPRSMEWTLLILFTLVRVFSNTHYVIQINPAKSTTSKYLFPKRHTCLPFERVSDRMKKISIVNFEQ